jgi:phosphosulfolactate phosphohydrolase-like enzyme
MIHIVGGTRGAMAAARRGEGNMAVVVDALRSSATIPALLATGASQVLLCPDLESARALYKNLENALLAGERDNAVPEDFHLGNSPLEAAEAEVSGRTVIFTSSNGAPILVACRGAGRILMGGPVNAEIVAGAAQRHLAAGGDVVIIAAGDHGEECDEDTAAAVLLALGIGPCIMPEQEGLVDLWRTRIAVEGLENLFRNSRHGRELTGLGFDSDITAAATPDLYPALPEAVEFIPAGRSLAAKVVAKA